MAEKKLGLYDSCVNPYVRTRKRVFNNPGSRLEKAYKMVIATEEDVKCAEKDGTFKKGLKMVSDILPHEGEWTILEDETPVNLYEKIQSFRSSCDLRIILKKYMNGDENALNQVAGIYLDTEDMPKNLAEMYATIKNMEKDFERLPLEMRKEYGHNPYAWMKDINSGAFAEKFGNPEKVSKSSEQPAAQTQAAPAAAEPKGDVANE